MDGYIYKEDHKRNKEDQEDKKHEDAQKHKDDQKHEDDLEHDIHKDESKMVYKRMTRKRIN